MGAWQMYKYPINITDTSVVQMPLDSYIKHVGMQGRIICLWAETRTDGVPHDRTFHVIGTGHLVPANSHYLGTVHDNPFVWHVYEEL